tara:strand:+ start:1991 stop:2581 length:591 start_codon:yes stop_codon:yes gene_type:complete
MNNYKKSIEIINNSNFTIKGLKTFIGREGYGVNANLYHKGKKVAFLLDSGNGGCLDIDWLRSRNGDNYFYSEIVKQAKESMKELITSLPKTMWSELGEQFISDGLDEYTYDEESVCNKLIDEALKVKDYNKWLRNVVVFNKKINEIEHYKAPKSDLNKTFRFKEGVMSGREHFSKLGVILNDLPKQEAYDYFNQYK